MATYEQTVDTLEEWRHRDYAERDLARLST